MFVTESNLQFVYDICALEFHGKYPTYQQNYLNFENKNVFIIIDIKINALRADVIAFSSLYFN